MTIIMQVLQQILHHLNKKAVSQEAPNNNSTINNRKNIETVASLKYLSNFWRTLDMQMINCEVNLILTLSENCVMTDITTQAAVPAQGGNPARQAIGAPTNATFKITDTKLYVPVGTLSTEDDNKVSE